jgi:hypothetical protein
MEKFNYHHLSTESGSLNENDLSYGVATSNVEDAEEWFVLAKERLLKVNHWDKYSTAFNATTLLLDHHGKELHRPAHKGDNIRITTGEHTLMAHIEGIEYDDYPDLDIETIALHIYIPADLKDDDTADSIKTLIIERRGKKLYADYHSRNEITNDAAMQALSHVKWEYLLKGIIEYDQA